MELRNYSFDSSEYDPCGKMTIAVLEVNNITIPLCEDCLKDLERDLIKFKNTIFCRDCTKWHRSEHGIKYGGTCEVKVEQNGESMDKILPRDYGYYYGTYFNETCEHCMKK